MIAMILSEALPWVAVAVPASAAMTLSAPLGGMDGFLGTRGSIMLDVVVLAMITVVPLLALSLYFVKRGWYGIHKRLQIVLGLILLLAVGLFELDMRIHGWQHRASPSPFWREGRWNDPIDWSLWIHLLCAVPTFVMWVLVLVRAWRHFPHPPMPGAHSHWHRRWGMASFVGMTLTAVTGWIFYWLAFVAT